MRNINNHFSILIIDSLYIIPNKIYILNLINKQYLCYKKFKHIIIKIIKIIKIL